MKKLFKVDYSLEGYAMVYADDDHSASEAITSLDYMDMRELATDAEISTSTTEIIERAQLPLWGTKEIPFGEEHGRNCLDIIEDVKEAKRLVQIAIEMDKNQMKFPFMEAKPGGKE